MHLTTMKLRLHNLTTSSHSFSKASQKDSLFKHRVPTRVCSETQSCQRESLLRETVFAEIDSSHGEQLLEQKPSERESVLREIFLSERESSQTEVVSERVFLHHSDLTDTDLTGKSSQQKSFLQEKVLSKRIRNLAESLLRDNLQRDLAESVLREKSVVR